MQQIKNKKRVRAYGEVFTAEREIKNMCDLVPVWKDLDATFLEPSCGNGNFLVEILKRKLELCKNGSDILRAVQSIYGVDLLPDNVKESKKRMYELIKKTGIAFDEKKVTLVLNCNIQQGDFLTKKKANGKEIMFIQWRINNND